MKSLSELLLLWLDTALWSINNAHGDVMASGAFYKLGYTTLAKEINHTGPTGGRGLEFRPIPI